MIVKLPPNDLEITQDPGKEAKVMKPTVTFACVFFFCLVTISAVLVRAGETQTKRTLQSASRESENRGKAVKTDKTKYVFQNSREPGRIDRVKVQLKVSGEMINVADGKEQREKMSVECNLDYYEKTLDMPAKDEDVSRSVRSYDRAEAQIKVGDMDFGSSLGPERTLIVDEITPQNALLFCPRGPLTFKELELIDVQADSLLMDRFLPDKPLAVGDSWKLSEKLMAQLLGLDEVGQTDVQCVLKEVTDQAARFEMSGKVAGAIDGVTSDIEIQARYRFILKSKRIDWLGMRILEQRRSSPVSDGFNTVAILQMTIVPEGQTERLSKADLKDLPMRSAPELTKLYHLSKQGGWELTHDRNWYVFRDKQELAIMRRLEKGEVIAQGHISSLPQGKPDKLVSLEEFQNDVKKALPKEFKEFVEAGQTVDDAGRRVLRVALRGEASDLPILWIYYHIADQEGRQMACVFTFEEKYADRFGKADIQIIESLRFTDAKQ
jgi:hypothetical protein